MSSFSAKTTDQYDRIRGEELSTPPWSGRGFIPVALESLVPGTQPGFRVFLEVDGSHVLVHSREAVFTEGDRERLLLLQQPTVFVRSEDSERYLAYLESNLNLIVDRQIPDPVKASLVYHSAQGLMREILAQPEDPRVIARSQRAADVTVDFILKGNDSFTHLLSNCAIDYRTYTHSVHVCIFTVALAYRLGYRPEELREIGAAVLLHDIGKTRVAPAILNKSDRLTPEEWQVMRQHPQWGVELVRGREGTTPLMEDVILHHHEKLDGSGYPEKLQGDRISPVVRMVTICDIFDAITTNRSYKRAMSTFETMALMEREMRGQIDFDILVELVLLLRRSA